MTKTKQPNCFMFFKTGPHAIRTLAVAICFCAMAWRVHAQSAENNGAGSNQVEQTAPQSAPATSTDTNAPAAKRDLAAAKFMMTCVGCHSLFGLKLTGPELSHVATWTPDALKQAIKRMEKNVGPLADNDVTALISLLKDSAVRERLKAEEAKIQAQFMAKMDPPDAAIGQSLFLGNRSLANGGLACSACHAAAGRGGNLAPDLTGVFAKMGRIPLISAIEKASFKIMAPHYRDHPITKQEAMHLTQYFSTLAPKVILTTNAPFFSLGAGTAVAMMASLGFYFRSKRTDRETKLQRRR